MFNRLYILLNAFLIKVFPLYSVVFAHSCYRGPFLGVVLVDTRKCKPPLFHIYLPCDVYILGEFFGCFLEFFQLVLVFLGQVQYELQSQYTYIQQLQINLLLVANSIVIGITSNIAVKIASGISGVASSGARDTYIVNKEL